MDETTGPREVPPNRSWDRSWQHWRRQPPTSKQQRIDVWIALAVMAGAMGTSVLINSMGAFVFGDARSLTEQLVWGAGLAAPLAVRRRFPLVVLIVVSALFIGSQAREVGDNFMPSVVLFLAIYTVGAWHRNRVIARWARIGVILAMFGWLGISLIDYLVTPELPFEQAAGPLDPLLASVSYDIVFNLLFFLSPYFFGNMAWLAARRQAELQQRAEELRESQEQNTRDAVVAERVRIARDLHDVVAHHVSVMGIKAGAARSVLDTDRELTRSALQEVEQTARTAVRELRGLLGVLRSDHPDPETIGGASPRGGDQNGEYASSPRLAQVPELVAMARSAGLVVNYSEHGAPRPVSDGIALSAYRVVQEALTNVVKHAAAQTVDVRIRYREHNLEVEVTDDGRGAASSVGQPDNGFGLVGMRERVAVHGGQVEAGPRTTGGYRVRVVFPTPLDSSSPDPDAEVATS